MRTLLRHAAAGGIASSYTQRLLAAFDESAQQASTAAHAAPGLAEPLTGREVEILRLIATGMRNQEIADHLFISLSTVAWFQAAGLRRSVVLTSQPWDQPHTRQPQRDLLMARPAATPQIDHARPSQQTARYSDLTMIDDVAAQRVLPPLPYRGARAATPGATPTGSASGRAWNAIGKGRGGVDRSPTFSSAPRS